MNRLKIRKSQIKVKNYKCNRLKRNQYKKYKFYLRPETYI